MSTSTSRSATSSRTSRPASPAGITTTDRLLDTSFVDVAPDPGPDGDWTAPGAYEVRPGVHRVPLPLPNDGLRAVNVYALTTPDGLVLVDSGWAIPEARTVLAAGLESLGCALTDIRRFLVTHIHRDHYQQAVTLRAELGMPVALGVGERESLELLRVPGRRPLQQQVQALRTLGASQLADMVQGF